MRQYLKIEVNSSNQDLIETIKTLDFVLPDNYTQCETSINDRIKLSFIISVPAKEPFDSDVIKKIVEQMLLKVHEKLGWSLLQPMSLSDSFNLVLQRKCLTGLLMSTLC